MFWPRITDLLTAGIDITSLRPNEDMGIPGSFTAQYQKKLLASTTCRYLPLAHISSVPSAHRQLFQPTLLAALGILIALYFQRREYAHIIFAALQECLPDTYGHCD
jgi:hypothetical protein